MRKGKSEAEVYFEVERRIAELGFEHVAPAYAREFERDKLRLSSDAPSVRVSNTGRIIR